MRKALVAALVLLMSAELAAAQSLNKKVELAAGGRTVAGPGAAKLVANSGLIVGSFLSFSANVCATLANVGKNSASLSITGTGGTIGTSAAPGGSTSQCRSAVTQVRVNCFSAGPCKVIWRIDDAP